MECPLEPAAPLHPILAIRSCFNLEGYGVGVVLCFVGFGPPHPTALLHQFISLQGYSPDVVGAALVDQECLAIERGTHVA